MAHKILRVGRGELDKNGEVNHVQLTHDSISRSHLSVFIDDDNRIFITDLNTVNGTYINGKRVIGDTMLYPGDVLKLGNDVPVQWERWIHIDPYSVNKKSWQPNSSYASDNVYVRPTVSTTKSNQNKFVIIGVFAALLFLLTASFLIYRYTDIFKRSGNEVSSTSTVYTKSDLEEKTFDELVELTKSNPTVIVGENEIISKDNKTVQLIISSDNKLMEVKQPSSGKTVVIKTNKDSVKIAQTPVVKTGSDDADNDGVDDFLDNCPDVPGPKSNNGCPHQKSLDADNDGVDDNNDQCPNVAGPAGNFGCPIPPKPTPSTTVFKNNQGNWEMQVNAGDETVSHFRSRIRQTPGINCPNPSDPEEIIEMNKIKLTTFQYKNGILPGGVYIEFKCN